MPAKIKPKKEPLAEPLPRADPATEDAVVEAAAAGDVAAATRVDKAGTNKLDLTAQDGKDGHCQERQKNRTLRTLAGSGRCCAGPSRRAGCSTCYGHVLRSELEADVGDHCLAVSDVD